MESGPGHVDGIEGVKVGKLLKRGGFGLLRTYIQISNSGTIPRIGQKFSVPK